MYHGERRRWASGRKKSRRPPPSRGPLVISGAPAKRKGKKMCNSRFSQKKTFFSQIILNHTAHAWNDVKCCF